MSRLSNLRRFATVCKRVEVTASVGCLLTAGALINAMFGLRGAHDPAVVVTQMSTMPLSWVFGAFVLIGFAAAVAPDVAWRVARRRHVRAHRGERP